MLYTLDDNETPLIDEIDWHLNGKYVTVKYAITDNKVAIEVL